MMEQPNFAADNPKEIVVPMKNGNTIKIVRVDPFGLFKLVLSSGGNLPDKYSGVYTELRQARKAIDHYLEDRGVEEGEQPPRPVIKYKNVPASKAQ